jgi:hypothetical protein
LPYGVKLAPLLKNVYINNKFSFMKDRNIIVEVMAPVLGSQGGKEKEGSKLG